MSDDKPSPFQDVRKGLGLLLRAARTAVDRLPKGGVEEVVKTSAREVGRAIENVASTIERTIEREIFRGKGERGQPPRRTGSGTDGERDGDGTHEPGPSPPTAPKSDEPKPPDAA